jgi:phosphotransferase system HPr (HPr) family protein
MGKAVSQTTIQNKYGFHARPSTSFALLAKTFSSAITIEVNGVQVDGKSVMALMSLGAMQGTVVRIHGNGDDAGKAVAALKAHVDDRFGGIE